MGTPDRAGNDSWLTKSRHLSRIPVSRRLHWALAAVLTVVAVLGVVGVAVANANRGHYVELIRYGRPQVVATVLVLAPLMLGVAAWLVLRSPVARGVSAGLAVLFAVILCWNGMQFVDFSAAFGVDPTSVTVLGVAPGGRFELVRLQYRSIGDDTEILRVRSREGLRSREASQDLACFVERGDLTPDLVFAGARFVDDSTVEVTTADGAAWTTTFDPHTLLATRTLAYCRT